MLSGFICECEETKRSNTFEIIRKVDVKKEETNDFFFRCYECGKDYSLDEVTRYK